MTILQQSSKALDRSLGAWFQQIQSATAKLPRFQRFEAWDRGRVTSFLDTVIQNLPVGITLVLEVGDQEKFISRHIKTAPDKPARVTEHILDGQQRLTAFWRALHNNYTDETYFVYIPEFDRDKKDSASGEECRVHCQPRWTKKEGRRFPVWADEPEQTLKRGLIPVDLLRPGDIAPSIDAWISKATSSYEPKASDPDAFNRLKEHVAIQARIKDEITKLRERIVHFNLPHLSLPAATPKDVALQVFINMNTNSKPLSLYDITVAEVEEAVGQSLHELQEKLERSYPQVARYGDPSMLILVTAALMQGESPNNKGIVAMDKARLVEDWNRVERVLARMADLLSTQGVHDEARLPTNAVLAVTAACYAVIPEHGDFLGRAEHLLRAYLWSSFFTDRYENAAATHAYADFKALKSLLEQGQFTQADYASVPVLNRSDYPLPAIEQLVRARWPKTSDRYGRAVLAVTTYFGARDFADNRTACYESLRSREYHHVFPDALLKEADIESFLALNCALLTWKTNRTIGRKDPLEYLRERVQWSDEATVRQRLTTHLLDFNQLAQATYGELHGKDFSLRLQADFHSFLLRRARLVRRAAERLSAGECISLEAILDETEPSPHESNAISLPAAEEVAATL